VVNIVKLEKKKTEEFEQINTGQTIMVFQTPIEIVNGLNKVYEEDGPTNRPDNIRKDIKNIFSAYDTEVEVEDNYNFIPDYIHEWIKDRIHQYLNFIDWQYAGIKPVYAWINDMEAYEYNEIHSHSGGHSALENKVGLSAIIGLKIPANMAKESSDHYHSVRDGWTQFISAANGHQFVHPTTLIKLKEGSCVIFPYDVLHQVYPHFSNQTRRTMSMNIDVIPHKGRQTQIDR
jgi:hypothetical protein